VRPWEMHLLSVQEWNKIMKYLDEEARENRRN
jgi:hypothetical protein